MEPIVSNVCINKKNKPMCKLWILGVFAMQWSWISVDRSSHRARHVGSGQRPNCWCFQLSRGTLASYPQTEATLPGLLHRVPGAATGSTELLLCLWAPSEQVRDGVELWGCKWKAWKKSQARHVRTKCMWTCQSLESFCNHSVQLTWGWPPLRADSPWLPSKRRT